MLEYQDWASSPAGQRTTHDSVLGADSDALATIAYCSRVPVADGVESRGGY